MSFLKLLHFKTTCWDKRENIYNALSAPREGHHLADNGFSRQLRNSGVVKTGHSMDLSTHYRSTQPESNTQKELKPF